MLRSSTVLFTALAAALAWNTARADEPEQTTPYDAAQPTDDTTQPPSVKVETTTPPPVIVQPVAPQPVVTPVPTETTPVVVEEHPVNVTVKTKPRRMMTVSLGGGVSDFSDSNLRDRTDLSGAYDARLAIGASSILAIEAAYVGTAAKISTLGLDDNAVLVSNGAEALARINLGTFDFQPYVMGGASWIHYSLVNDSFNTSDVRDNDDVIAIPFGGGVSTYLGDSGLVLDGRFTYRATFDDDLIKGTDSNNNSVGSGLDNWLVTANLGYSF